MNSTRFNFSFFPFFHEKLAVINQEIHLEKAIQRADSDEDDSDEDDSDSSPTDDLFSYYPPIHSLFTG